MADKAYQETMSIFIPEDKLNLGVTVRATLSINPKDHRAVQCHFPKRGNRCAVGD